MSPLCKEGQGPIKNYFNRMALKLRNTYFILRHGETIYQTTRNKIIYPLLEKTRVKLTQKGEMAAQKAAKLLEKEEIDIIYSSDLYRTYQTASIVAKQLEISKINLDKRLRDINLGIYHGKRKEDFYKEFPDPMKRFSKKPKRGESWNDLRGRMKRFLRSIDKLNKGKNILVVSHGDPLWMLEGVVKKMTNQEMLDEIFIKKHFIKTAEFRKIN